MAGGGGGGAGAMTERASYGMMLLTGRSAG
jgi:hypothetical protein